MLRFHIFYFLLAVLLFMIEVFIALYVKGGLVRHFLGDVLVVGLIYYILRAFLTIAWWRILVFVFMLAFIIEGLQYLKLADLLGFPESSVAAVVLGNTFDPLDLLAYLLGAGLVLLLEVFIQRSRSA